MGDDLRQGERMKFFKGLAWAVGIQAAMYVIIYVVVANARW